MKTLMAILLLVPLCILIACNGDDGGTGPEPEPDPTVTSVWASSAPSMTDPNDAVWNSATETMIDLPNSSLSTSVPVAPSAAAAAADVIGVKSLLHGDRLYLRLSWHDDTRDTWKGAWQVTQVNPDGTAFNVTQWDTSVVNEDRLMVLFENEADDNWDVWQWRALTTGAVRLAEGASLSGATLTIDAGNIDYYDFNVDHGDSKPTFLHEDSAEFVGSVMWVQDTIRWTSIDGGHGWTTDQYIPYYMFDTTTAWGSAYEAARGSRWDLQSIFTYENGGYVVVLSGPIASTANDDLAFTGLDKVTLRVGVADNEYFRMTGGSSDQAFSDDFVLDFPAWVSTK